MASIVLLFAVTFTGLSLPTKTNETSGQEEADCSPTNANIFVCTLYDYVKMSQE